MFNKKTIAVISGAAGVCVLAVSAAAGYSTANGYDALKRSLLDTIDYTNCRADLAASIEIDGAEAVSGTVLYEFDSENARSHFKGETVCFGTEEKTDCYNCGDKEYSLAREFNPDAEEGLYYRYDYNGDTVRGNLWGIETEDRKTADKFLRFAELAADTVVGDLKNNFVCVEDGDDAVHYSVTLDSVQIPELVNAGLSMVFSMSNSAMMTTSSYVDGNGGIVSESVDLSQNPENVEYYTALMGDDPIVDNVTMNFVINKDGSFRAGDMTTVFTGGEHTMTFRINGGISDVGSTEIVSPDEQGLRVEKNPYVYTEEYAYTD